jgi:hypothetical protein
VQPTDATVSLRSAGGDRLALRGVPVVGVGLGAVRGSSPVAALAAKERHRARRPM